MIEKFTEGQAKDEILKYCIRKKNSIIASTEFQKALFPNTHVDVVKILIEKIGNESNGIVAVNLNSRSKYMSTNGAAQMFLDQGGFTKIEYDLNSESNFVKEKELLEFENLKLQKEAAEHQKSIRNLESQIKGLTRDNLRLNNWDIRFRWQLAIGGFIVGLITKYLI
jgi:hypothetical protein